MTYRGMKMYNIYWRGERINKRPIESSKIKEIQEAEKRSVKRGENNYVSVPKNELRYVVCTII